MTLFEAAVDIFFLNIIDLAQNISQSKFGEVGAGVALGSLKTKFQHSHPNFHLHIGSNAIRALQGLGVLEEILAKANSTGPNQRLFNFISGTDDEQVYDVSFINTTGEVI